jgi:4-amino-4-deoxy-L-arabinose transferase-like glycosyltransferase
VNTFQSTRADHVFSALAMAAILILTAWGNAIAMLLVSALGLCVAALLLRGRRRSRGQLAAVVLAAMLAAAIAAWWLLAENDRLMKLTNEVAQGAPDAVHLA